MIGHVLVNTNEVMTNDYQMEHQALDLIGNGNSISDVISLEDGVVELVVSDVVNTDRNARGTDSYGNFVKIRHGNGKKTLYAHLKYGSVNVKKGEKIEKGEKIGTMGATGNAYGVHLHFEVRNQDESRENPYEYLWGQKQIKEEKLKKTNVISKLQEQNVEVPKEEIKEENINKISVKKEEKMKEEKEESIKDEKEESIKYDNIVQNKKVQKKEIQINKTKKTVNIKNEYIWIQN